MSTNTSFSMFALPSLSHPEADRAEARAKTRGHAAGYAAGLHAAQRELADQRIALQAEFDEAMERGRADVQRTLDALAAAIRAADARALPVVEDAQNTLAVAAIELAEAVIGQELADGERAARSALARALSSVPVDGLTNIRMNPDDIARLAPEERAEVPAELIADPALQPGDAIAVLPNGWLDARIETALARAKSALLGEES
ncbi:flagellar assembly protein FliH [Okibacterium sp. HSC-33S16]|uniref:FliH/SctL family protein n=1 Tax=Okibacterium sp. HSC-33S16 TaxID=2910965 RepID=UPI0020A2025D|nr:FliH/SctL family protein [Okibacterium sp. HSC-33S16]MCP2032927.1 flagellar assembly protein FliH [Okibacterium sp. HSC-33S16]